MKYASLAIGLLWSVIAATGFAATTQPAVEQLGRDIDAAENQLSQLIPNSRMLSDAATRAAVAEQAIPLLKTITGELSDLLAANPADKTDRLGDQSYYLAMLTVLGGADSSRLDAMAKSDDANESDQGLRGQVLVQWWLARDSDTQTRVVDQLEKLDAIHHDSQPLTNATFACYRTAATPELKGRLLKITLAMKTPLAQELQQSEAEEQEMKAMNENKPLAIIGKTVAGKDFTTADWKGKVILVDFWATWCGPCVAELPRVRKMYAEYHDKGLEILGVSNDFAAQALTDYAAKNAMPWPELYDATEAAKKEWNPLTNAYGIYGIPVMFLIDKQGVCRSVDARENMEDLIPKLLAE